MSSFAPKPKVVKDKTQQICDAGVSCTCGKSHTLVEYMKAMGADFYCDKKLGCTCKRLHRGLEDEKKFWVRQMDQCERNRKANAGQKPVSSASSASPSSPMSTDSLEPLIGAMKSMDISRSVQAVVPSVVVPSVAVASVKTRIELPNMTPEMQAKLIAFLRSKNVNIA